MLVTDLDSKTWVTVMLVISLCWWLYDGDWFEMLVAESLCWRLFSLCWWFSQCIKSVTNILNRSPTSQTCHQHIWSPTSVTNIDVTKFCRQQHFSKNSIFLIILPIFWILGALIKNHEKIMKIIQLSQIEIKLNSLTSDQ